jgi:hypothetical protein
VRCGLPRRRWRHQALGARDRPAEIDDILEGCLGGLRIRRRRLHEREERSVFLDQWFDVGIEIGRRHIEFVGSTDARGQRVGQVLVSAHHLQAGEVEGLPRTIGQLLLSLDLSPPLGQDGPERA